MKVKLKVKLITVVSSIIVLLSVILTVISSITNYRSSLALINDFIPKVVNSTALAIGNQIGEYISTVEAMSRNASLVQSTTNEQRLTILQGLQDPAYHCFGFMDASGNIVSTNGEEPADLRFYEASMGGKEYFSEPFKDEHEDLLLGLASYPVYNPSGNVQGVLFGIFDFSTICDIVKSTSVSANTSPTIYNQEGTLMAYGDQQLIIDGYNLYTQWLDLLKNDTVVRQAYGRALSGQQSLEYLDVDGDKIVFAYAPVLHTTWSYNFYVPMSDFMGSFYSSLWTNITAALLLLIFSVIVVSLYAARITRPIENLRSRIMSLSQGDLHTPFHVEHTRDELEDLSSALSQTTQYLSTTVSDVSDKLKTLGECNLNLSFDLKYEGDFSEIGDSFRIIDEQLNGIFKAINEAAHQVTNGAGQVSSGAQALAMGSTQQASATQQLAATINDVSSQVKNNAEHAGQASSKANLVGEEMVQSNSKMQQMMQAMTEISESSSEIGKIIKTIEDIAFQTNILALNAAVEAARAGAAGKGFAVVADEVRNLASKSAEASKNTSALIENSLKAVENGTKIADDTAKSMLSAVEGAKDVSATIDKISDASKVQADSVTQISQGIDQISSVIQTNSATAEQSAAAAQELTDQAQTLKALIGRFQLKGEDLQAPADFPAESQEAAFASLEEKY